MCHRNINQLSHIGESPKQKEINQFDHYVYLNMCSRIKFCSRCADCYLYFYEILISTQSHDILVGSHGFLFFSPFVKVQFISHKMSPITMNE